MKKNLSGDEFPSHTCYMPAYYYLQKPQIVSPAPPSNGLFNDWLSSPPAPSLAAIYHTQTQRTMQFKQ